MSTLTKRKVYEKPTDWTLLSPIYSSHLKRLGWLRTYAGGLSMYTCIPALIILHITCCVIGYQWLISPILKAPKVRWKKYVIIDRQRIEGMNRFDVLNCMFCGYANGLVTMLNIELDNISKTDLSALSLWRRLLASLVILLFIPLIVFFEVSFQITYNILVSRPLGMQRLSIKDAYQVLAKARYASQFSLAVRLTLFAAKSTSFRFTMALEQIESAWCPLKHLENREGIVYPSHHDRFFGPNELEEMRAVLSTVGTVSERKPKHSVIEGVYEK